MPRSRHSRLSPSPNRRREDDRLLKKRRRDVIHEPAPVSDLKSNFSLDEVRRRRRRVLDSGLDHEEPSSCVQSSRSRIDFRENDTRDDPSWHQNLSRRKLSDSVASRSNGRRAKGSPSRRLDVNDVTSLRSSRTDKDKPMSRLNERNGRISRDRDRDLRVRDSKERNGARDASKDGRSNRDTKVISHKDTKQQPSFRSSSRQSSQFREQAVKNESAKPKEKTNHTAKEKHSESQCVTDVPSILFNPDPPISLAEGPPGPLHVPRTIAQLRVVLLTGFISSKTTAADPHLPRLIIPCPIHSLIVTHIIKEFYKNTYGISHQALLPLNSAIITQELFCLSKPLADASTGPFDELLSIEDLTGGELIVNNYDFLRCDSIIRAALRGTHPSGARALWQKSRASILCCSAGLTSPLELGSGVGVEARETILSSAAITAVARKGCSSETSSFLARNVLIKPQGSVLVDSAGITTGRPASVATSQQMLYPPIMPTATATGGTTGVGASGVLVPSAISRRPDGARELMITNAQSTDTPQNVDIEELLSAPTAKEQQVLDSGAELRDLLSVPTAKHSLTTRQFQSRGGSRVQQICRHGTRYECLLASTRLYNEKKLKGGLPVYHSQKPQVCSMIHFRRILLPHTDLSLGDCSYLDTCRHMSTCRFVHYEVDLDTGTEQQRSELLERMTAADT